MSYLRVCVCCVIARYGALIAARGAARRARASLFPLRVSRVTLSGAARTARH